MLVFAKTGYIILGTGDVFGRGRVGSQKDLRGNGVRELKKLLARSSCKKWTELEFLKKIYGG